MPMNRSFTIIPLLLLCSVIALAQEQMDTIKASKVTSDLMRTISFSQTGHERMESLRFEVAPVLGSPDIIRTLQGLPGVAMGNEMSSGLYVRGGDGSDNLYMFDGAPVWQTAHMGGMFSVVNSDILDNVDVYKSGFPSRFGGKISSVEDISVKVGDFDQKHVKYSIGLTDGRITLDGPFKNKKTSYLVSLRQNWMSLFTKPAFKAAGNLFPDRMTNYLSDGWYGFTEIDGKISKRLCGTSSLEFSLLANVDFIKYSDHYGGDETSWSDHGLNLSSNWGNIVAVAAWKTKPADMFYSYLRVYYSRGYASISTRSDYYDDNPFVEQKLVSIESNDSGIGNPGLRWDSVYLLGRGARLRFGVEGNGYISSPHRIYSYEEKKRYKHPENPSMEDNKMSVIAQKDLDRTMHYSSKSVAGYASFEWTPVRWFSSDVGFRYDAYFAKGMTFGYPEPRLAVSIRPVYSVALKASYSRMYQPLHMLSSSSFDFPGNCWLPSTKLVQPAVGNQIAVGMEYSGNDGWNAGIEAYLKNTDHLHEYGGPVLIYPPLDEWENNYLDGKGRARGIETRVSKEGERISVAASYSYSISERMFEDFYVGWYPDRFDNRHSIHLSFRYHFLKGEFNADWFYHGGNRITAPEYYYPTDSPEEYTYNGYYSQFELAGAPYPNNRRLPSYHRLDIGYSQYGKTKRGKNRIISVGLYNAYNRKNVNFARIDKGFASLSPSIIYVSAFPIMPTLRWSYSF